MKPFTLFFGASGVLGTHNVTANPKYQLVVETVSQLRAHLLNDRAFRVPILSLFNSVYEDDSQFPEELKENTPDIDQISNMKKIRQIHSHPPSDNDVLEFLTNSFPDLYLDLGNFSLAELVLWGETKSGRGEVAKEEITINVHLVQLWLEAVSDPLLETFQYVHYSWGYKFIKGINSNCHNCYGIIVHVCCCLPT